MNRMTTAFLVSLTVSASALAGEPTIPKLAVSLVATVHQTALKGEPEKLRHLMTTDFTSSFGGDGGIDEAIDLWNENPAHLQQLAKSTAGQCELVDPHEVICPPESQSGYRAGFKFAGGQWLFAYFVTGD